MGGQEIHHLQGLRHDLDSVVTGWGLLMVQASWLVGAFLAVVSIGFAHDLGTVPLVFVAVTIGMILQGSQMRTSAWFR